MASHPHPLNRRTSGSGLTGLSHLTDLSVLALLSMLSTLAAIILLSSLPAAAQQSGTFSDVPTSHWAYHYIEECAQRGIIDGKAPGIFDPSAAITRAEFVKMLVGAYGLQVPDADLASFSDTGPEHWAHLYVELAYRIGFVEGATKTTATGQGLFLPSAPVTREQAATILVRALAMELEARNTSYQEIQTALVFSDAGSVSSWARKHLAVAVNHHLIEGYGDGRLDPKGTLTRAQAAALMVRFQAQALAGDKIALVDGLEIRHRQEMVMTATAYGEFPDNEWYGYPSYLGLGLREGIVAVDPEVIPLGTHLYVEGYGYAVAADIGGAVKGAKIDLFFDAPRDELLRFGVKQKRIYILD